MNRAVRGALPWYFWGMKPKYAEVYDILIEQISRLNPGDKLDSEIALSKKLDVSPMTVRRALSKLSDEGRTYGIPGKGTFVSDNAPEAPSQQTPSVSFIPAGAHAELISASIAKASEENSNLLGVSRDDFVYTISRMWRSLGDVVCVETAVVNAKYFPDFLSEKLDSDLSERFDAAYGRPVEATASTLAAIMPADDLAGILGVPGPCIEQRSVESDRRGNVLQFVTRTFATDITL